MDSVRDRPTDLKFWDTTLFFNSGTMSWSMIGVLTGQLYKPLGIPSHSPPIQGLPFHSPAPHPCDSSFTPLISNGRRYKRQIPPQGKAHGFAERVLLVVLAPSSKEPRTSLVTSLFDVCPARC